MVVGEWGVVAKRGRPSGLRNKGYAPLWAADPAPRRAVEY